MFMIKATNIKKEFDGTLLFEGVNIEVEQHERVAIIGKNGIGKTTLINLLCGELESSDGTIYRKHPVHEWGYVRQHLTIQNDTTAEEMALQANNTYWRSKQKLNEAEQHLTLSQDEQAMDTYQHAYDLFEKSGGYEWEQHVQEELTRMGIGHDLWTKPFTSLSGGEKTRVQLAGVLALKPAILVLDEPTNHVDYETIVHIEQVLKQYKGTVLLISHDRSFLNSVATAIIELHVDGSRKFKGNYDAYRSQKTFERETQLTLYKKQEQERQHLQEAIAQYRQWFTKAHNSASTRNPFAKKKANKNMTRYKAKEKALERLEENRVDRPKNEAGIHAKFHTASFEAHTLITLKDISFAYDISLLKDISFTVNRHEKIALLGQNGAGKSTIVKLLTGDLEPTTGDIYYHPTCHIGYFSQELAGLHEDETILDSLLSLPNMTQSAARTILACFLFRREDVYKRMKDLSMGERCRVAFVKLYFSGANLLILDEPTNYLDLTTRERIEEALHLYPGAIVFVSHDRYFTDKLATKIVSLEDGKATTFDGTYKEYTEHTHEDEDDKYRKQLEYRLLCHMHEDEPETDEAKQQLMETIRALQQKIEQYRA
ncbi:ribosomal protection-like ABC-F family protein [Priestia taiwanensis]|uniref:ABC transporter ATP-binding protein n=1 Tax=Priestia taiwanensis TaxID=1347902 RepID=A0A917ARY6_9BACI|nr:ABC-F type ribosomal protection protein [Priestia taiwanensis]MBM7363189.1 ATPase subunit of ABC transporter with duplicated ATPase domains [Priestia taiwanensis]GGE68367.1 ABC transporter ATP-binding protein [Priestia taiwanensis]